MYLPFIIDISGAGLVDMPNPIPLNTEFIVGGYFEEGDGGGGTFMWRPGSSLLNPDFGITFNALNDTNGYFERIFSGPINVRWFGAILGATDPRAPTDRPIDPLTGLPYSQPINDVSPYVALARDSEVFADNGTLYFPKGDYPGSFEIKPIYVGGGVYLRNEINIVGDGQGTVLRSNGTVDPVTGLNFAVLRLGYRGPHWRYAKVSNLKIDGSYESIENRFSYGVVFESPVSPHGLEAAGRWVFEQVFFTNCDRGVFKQYGNIGNHYIDCTWERNNYGIYADALVDKMQSGCDRYSGGHFDGHSVAAIRYADLTHVAGQIIIDGTIIENTAGWGIKIYCTGNARMLVNAVSIRNVFMGRNGDEDGNGGDMLFEGVRSVRIDDTNFFRLKLIASSVNLFNCRHDSNWAAGQLSNAISVDTASSLVAYEHRYNGPPTDKVFVRSISFDSTNETGYWDPSNPTNPLAPAPWIPTSVWGPLRAVTCTKLGIVLSNQFEYVNEDWDVFNTTTPYTTSWISPMRVLGVASNRLYLPSSTSVWAKNVVGTINTPGYYVWSIHTYLEYNQADDVSQVWGEIANAGGGQKLGLVYFKNNQWACSYGMKWIDPSGGNIDIRLSFHTSSASDAAFWITDYQIIHFEELADANAYVNSLEFTPWFEGVEQGNKDNT